MKLLKVGVALLDLFGPGGVVEFGERDDVKCVALLLGCACDGDLDCRDCV